MSKLDIIKLPDPLLKEVSAPIEQVDDKLRHFMDDMLATMYDAAGVGLAAIQVAVLKRVIVIDAGREEARDPMFMVNPKILTRSSEMRVHEEGCLSIPDVFAEVERPAKIRVEYIDRDGKRQELEAEGLLATVIQHEVDHLNGVLFIDHLSRLKRDMVVKKYLKTKKDAAAV